MSAAEITTETTQTHTIRIESDTPPATPEFEFELDMSNYDTEEAPLACGIENPEYCETCQ